MQNASAFKCIVLHAFPFSLKSLSSNIKTGVNNLNVLPSFVLLCIPTQDLIARSTAIIQAKKYSTTTIFHAISTCKPNPFARVAAQRRPNCRKQRSGSCYKPTFGNSSFSAISRFTKSIVDVYEIPFF